MASAGRILIMPKGNYDPSVTYEMLDMVHYNGTSWLAKKTVSNIEPSAANSEYWHSMLDFDPNDYLPKEGGVLTGDARIKKDLPSFVLEVSDTHRTILNKNANSNLDGGTELIDETDNVKTILTIKNGAVRLFKEVDGVQSGSIVIAEITD